MQAFYLTFESVLSSNNMYSLHHMSDPTLELEVWFGRVKLFGEVEDPEHLSRGRQKCRLNDAVQLPDCCCT